MLMTLWLLNSSPARLRCGRLAGFKTFWKSCDAMIVFAGAIARYGVTPLRGGFLQPQFTPK